MMTNQEYEAASIAACIVNDIRETAWLGGQVTGVSK